jgi:hypothetical protein
MGYWLKRAPQLLLNELIWPAGGTYDAVATATYGMRELFGLGGHPLSAS